MSESVIITSTDKAKENTAIQLTLDKQQLPIIENQSTTNPNTTNVVPVLAEKTTPAPPQEEQLSKAKLMERRLTEIKRYQQTTAIKAKIRQIIHKNRQDVERKEEEITALSANNGKTRGNKGERRKVGGMAVNFKEQIHVIMEYLEKRNLSLQFTPLQRSIEECQSELLILYEEAETATYTSSPSILNLRALLGNICGHILSNLPDTNDMNYTLDFIDTLINKDFPNCILTTLIEDTSMTSSVLCKIIFTCLNLNYHQHIKSLSHILEHRILELTSSSADLNQLDEYLQFLLLIYDGYIAYANLPPNYPTMISLISPSFLRSIFEFSLLNSSYNRSHLPLSSSSFSSSSSTPTSTPSPLSTPTSNTTPSHTTPIHTFAPTSPPTITTPSSPSPSTNNNNPPLPQPSSSSSSCDDNKNDGNINSNIDINNNNDNDNNNTCDDNKSNNNNVNVNNDIISSSPLPSSSSNNNSSSSNSSNSSSNNNSNNVSRQNSNKNESDNDDEDEDDDNEGGDENTRMVMMIAALTTKRAAIYNHSLKLLSSLLKIIHFKRDIVQTNIELTSTLLTMMAEIDYRTVIVLLAAHSKNRLLSAAMFDLFFRFLQIFSAFQFYDFPSTSSSSSSSPPPPYPTSSSSTPLSSPMTASSPSKTNVTSSLISSSSSSTNNNNANMITNPQKSFSPSFSSSSSSPNTTSNIQITPPVNTSTPINNNNINNTNINSNNINTSPFLSPFSSPFSSSSLPPPSPPSSSSSTTKGVRLFNNEKKNKETTECDMFDVLQLLFSMIEEPCSDGNDGNDDNNNGISEFFQSAALKNLEFFLMNFPDDHTQSTFNRILLDSNHRNPYLIRFMMSLCARMKPLNIIVSPPPPLPSVNITHPTPSPSPSPTSALSPPHLPNIVQ